MSASPLLAVVAALLWATPPSAADEAPTTGVANDLGGDPGGEDPKLEGPEDEAKAARKARREAKREAKRAESMKPDRFEWAVLPVLAANSDAGFMFGATGIVAKFDPKYEPFRWRGLASGIVSVREFQGRTQVLMQKYYAEFDIPGLLGGRFRLRPTAGYESIPNAGYYGIGNNTGFNSDPASSSEEFRYGRSQAYGRASGELEVFEDFMILGGATFRYLFTKVYEDSLLARTDELLREAGVLAVSPLEDHPELLLAGGVRYDTRDHEVDPSVGLRLELNARVGYGWTQTTSDFDFAGFGIDLRFYLPLGTDRLVLAQRLLGDMITGRPPLYELDHAGAFPQQEQIAGGNGIRGIPAGRFHGRAKVLSSTELRVSIARFSLGSQRFVAGVGAFADAGRVWASDFQAIPALDGTGFNPRWGAGGGARLRWGETMLLRADVAYSPFGDPTQPVSFYIVANHAF